MPAAVVDQMIIVVIHPVVELADLVEEVMEIIIHQAQNLVNQIQEVVPVVVLEIVVEELDNLEDQVW
jgi:hypothetical protein